MLELSLDKRQKLKPALNDHKCVCEDVFPARHVYLKEYPTYLALHLYDPQIRCNRLEYCPYSTHPMLLEASAKITHNSTQSSILEM